MLPLTRTEVPPSLPLLCHTQVVMWEMLTWELPFEGENIWQLAPFVAQGGRLPIPDRGALPGKDTLGFAGLDTYIAIMKRCWSQDPAERPSFKEVADDLRCGRGRRGGTRRGQLLATAPPRSVRKATKPLTRWQKRTPNPPPPPLQGAACEHAGPCATALPTAQALAASAAGAGDCHAHTAPALALCDLMLQQSTGRRVPPAGLSMLHFFLCCSPSVLLYMLASISACSVL